MPPNLRFFELQKYKTNILTEYGKRQHHKQLIFAPDELNRVAVYNIQPQKFIGYSHMKFGDFTVNTTYNNRIKLAHHIKKCNIIENAQENLICTYNAIGEFSIFDINTGVDIAPTKSFKKKKPCLKMLKAMIKTS